MSWKTDPEATKVARELFEGSPVVKRNGEQYVVLQTPFGRVELYRLAGRREFLAAAEAPPEETVAIEAERLPPDVAAHLQHNRLRPWRIVAAPSGNVTEALRRLADGEAADGDVKASSNETATPHSSHPASSWCPFLVPLAEHGEVVGEHRVRVAEYLTGIMDATQPLRPLPALVGPAGVGKRTIAAAAARALGLRPQELPLSRILFDRFCSTALELLLETVIAGSVRLGADELVVLSDAEVLGRLSSRLRRQVVQELSRLPRRVLLASAIPEGCEVIPLVCHALKTMDEVNELVRLHYPQLLLDEPVLNMISRSASVPEAGVLPGRALYLVRLALSLAEHGNPTRLTPDDVAPAQYLTERLWGIRPHGSADDRPDSHVSEEETDV